VVSPGASWFLDDSPLSVCAPKEAWLPWNASNAIIVYSLEPTIPIWPSLGNARLEAEFSSPAGTSLLVADFPEMGDERLVVSNATATGVIARSIHTGGRFWLNAAFVAVICPQTPIEPPVLLDMRRRNWTQNVSTEMFAICGGSRDFHVDIQSVSVNGTGMVLLSVERQSFSALGTPSMRVGFDIGFGSEFTSMALTKANHVAIPFAAIRNASAAGATKITGTLTRTPWNDAPFVQPEGLDFVLNAEVFPNASSSNCTPANETIAGDQTITIALCADGVSVVTITPDKRDGSGLVYDQVVSLSLLPNADLGTEPEVEIEATVPEQSVLWSGTGWQRSSRSTTIVAPYSLVRSSNQKFDVVVKVRNLQGASSAVRLQTSRSSCFADGFSNSEAAFSINADSMPEIPFSRSTSTVSASACFLQNEYFKVAVSGADFIDVRLFYQSVTASGFDAPLLPSDPQLATLQILTLAVVNRGGTAMISDTNFLQSAYWGRMVSFETKNRIDTGDEFVFVKVVSVFAAASNFSLEITWRRTGESVQGVNQTLPTSSVSLGSTTGASTTGLPTAVTTALSSTGSSVNSRATTGISTLSESAGSEGDNVVVVVVIVVIAVLVAIALGSAAIWWISRRREDSGESLPSISTSDAFSDPVWDIAESDIRIMTKIGAGAHGGVYECRIEGKRGKFAVKCVALGAPPAVEALRRELDFLRRVDHENIVALVGFSNMGDQIAVIMELYGGTLASEVSRKTDREDLDGWFEGVEVARWLRDIASAVHYLHTLDEPIAHRGAVTSLHFAPLHAFD
jgi:Protein kinase domain